MPPRPTPKTPINIASNLVLTAQVYGGLVCTRSPGIASPLVYFSGKQYLYHADPSKDIVTIRVNAFIRIINSYSPLSLAKVSRVDSARTTVRIFNHP